MNKIFRIAKKEFGTFFSSPTAFIFMGAFLATNLFVFFWVETFFATNITEIRPLFKWMPILLIFLASAITMRLWAEENRAGTLELLLTSPTRPYEMVLGKFLGCLGLVLVSLLLTLPLPCTISFMGPLDWGPVWGGYLASICLAAAYISIGLYVSVKSENQIVSLIGTALICSFFYLLGSDLLTALFGTKGGELLKLLGSGSRFESITRGIIDFRDLYYYLAIVGVFLSLNILGLEKIRWAGNPSNNNHLRWRLLTWLCVANLLVANLWLSPITLLRADVTQGNIYSLSPATKNYLKQLKEPLLIRGYFSAKTHPLLSPLVPQLQDLLKEYGIAGGKQVTLEFTDPLENPDLEQEAGQKYGIRPVPFQTTDKYQASVTNSYFDILIQYGDQFETLGFRELIEVKVMGDNDLKVELRNPEYDITRAIRKTLFSYQGKGNLFSEINKPIHFTGYFSPLEQLPEQLVELKKELNKLLSDFKQHGGDQFSFSEMDPDANGGQLASELQQKFGFRPMSASLFDQRTFWFYMMLQSGEQAVEIALPQELDGEGLKRSMEAALKRFATGFSKNVALHTQPLTQGMPQYGIPPQGKQFSILRDILNQEHVVTDTDLKSGKVPADADILILASPENLDDKQLFGVDQFLMQGGTIILASSPYDIEMGRQLGLKSLDSGLGEWLAHHGITLKDKLILDSQNSPFPIPSQRNVGGFTIQETKMIDYPFFVDIRKDGMDEATGILSGIQQVTLNWSSPITIDEAKKGERTVTTLLRSSPDSWLTSDLNLQPDFTLFPQIGFAKTEGVGRQTIGILMEGSFRSYFAGKKSPLLVPDDKEKQQDEAPANQDAQTEEPQIIDKIIEKSPESSRLFCFASNSFLADAIVSLGSGVRRTGYLEPVQLIANSVDWALEERSLLEIRGRSHFSRPLAPLSKDGQLFFEYLNYGLALIGLFIVWCIQLILRRRARSKERIIIQQLSRRV